MFKTGLNFPVKQVSLFLEGTLMPIIYRNTKMVTVSKSTREAMKNIGLGKKQEIEIIPNGVFIKVPELDKTKSPSILYLGRLRFYKRVDILIKAFEQIQRKHQSSKLIIAGSGEDESHLKKLAKDLRLSSKIVFKGRVSEEEKANLYTMSWVAVQPSIVEGWGLTNLEANFCGTPVVASDTDGLKESVVHDWTGLLVESENVNAFAEAISRIIEDNKYRNTLEKNALEWAHRFSWDNSSNIAIKIINNKLRKHYKTVIERGELAYE